MLKMLQDLKHCKHIHTHNLTNHFLNIPTAILFPEILQLLGHVAVPTES